MRSLRCTDRCGSLLEVQSVDQNLFDIGRCFHHGVLDFTRQRPQQGCLDRGGASSMHPKSNGATRDLHDVQTEAVNSKMRPQPIHRPANARFKIIRVETVQQQHGLNLLVFHQPRQNRSSVFSHGHNAHQLGQADAMQIKHKREKLTRGLFRGRIWMRVKHADQFLEPMQGMLRVLAASGGHRYPRPTPNIGECTVSIVLPLPRYICTPHGRHGSKLRTARMMSMPLKFSGPFSSKIGVPVIASS